MISETSSSSSPSWKDLYRLGGLAALSVVVIMVVQMAVFIVWPPPTTVVGWIMLFQDNWMIGRIDMDLLLIVDYVLLIVVFIAMWAAIRRFNEPFMMLALILQIVGTASYFASTTAFQMLSLSNQYAAATTDAERSVFLTAGHVMLLNWQGTAFDISYILTATAILIVSVVMFRSGRPLFSRYTACVGIAEGLLGFIPSSTGQIGLIFSLVSLSPLAIWLVLIGKTLLKVGRSLKWQEPSKQF